MSFEPAMAAADSGHIVLLEAEDMAISSGWELKQDEAASGGQYLAYTGPNSFNKVTPHRLQGEIIIETPGRYTVKWFMRQPDEVPGDQANDAWINFPDATQFGKSQVVGFHKFLGRSKGVFSLNGELEIDKVHSWMVVDFPRPGTYTIEIAGRSNGFQLDRMVLFQGMKFDEAKDQFLATNQ